MHGWSGSRTHVLAASEGAQAVLQIVHKATGMAATVTLGYAALDWLTSDAVPIYLKKARCFSPPSNHF